MPFIRWVFLTQAVHHISGLLVLLPNEKRSWLCLRQLRSNHSYSQTVNKVLISWMQKESNNSPEVLCFNFKSLSFKSSFFPQWVTASVLVQSWAKLLLLLGASFCGASYTCMLLTKIILNQVLLPAGSNSSASSHLFSVRTVLYAHILIWRLFLPQQPIYLLWTAQVEDRPYSSVSVYPSVHLWTACFCSTHHRTLGLTGAFGAYHIIALNYRIIES